MPDTYTLDEVLNAQGPDAAPADAGPKTYTLDEVQGEPEKPFTASDILEGARQQIKSTLGGAFNMAGRAAATVGNIPTALYNAGSVMTHAYPPIPQQPRADDLISGPFHAGESFIPDSVLDTAQSGIEALLRSRNPMDPFGGYLPPTPVSEGLSRSGRKLISGLATPDNVALPVAGKAGLAAFLGLTLAETPDKIEEAAKVFSNPRSSRADKWEAAGNLAGNAAIAAAAAFHLKPAEVKSRFDPTDPRLQPFIEAVAKPPQEPPPVAPVAPPVTPELPAPIEPKSTVEPAVDQTVNNEQSNTVQLPGTQPIESAENLPANITHLPTEGEPKPGAWSIVKDGEFVGGAVNEAAARRAAESLGPEYEVRPANETDAHPEHIQQDFAAGVEPKVLAEPQSENAPVTVEAPKLKPGENQGDINFADEGFTLTGEKGKDFDRISAEKAKTEQTRKEAADIAAKQQMELPGVPKRGAKGFQTWQYHPNGMDVLDVINDLGGVRGHLGKKGSKGFGEYDAYNESFNQGRARLLRNKNGLAPDKLLEGVNSSKSGFHFDTIDQMYEAVKRASADREGIRTAKGEPISEPHPDDIAKVEAQIREQSKIGDVARKAANRFRSIADSLGPKPGELGTFGIIPETLKKLLHEIGDGLEQGGEIADVVDAAIRKYASHIGDVTGFRAWAMKGGEEPLPVPPGPETTGIAARVTSDMAGRGRIEEVSPGEGISAEGSVQRGRELLNQGRNAESVVDEFNKTKKVSADDMAIVRARAEWLAQAANDAADVHGVDSPQYKAAWQAESDWIKQIKPMQTEWHKIGQAQQGETEINTGTFHGLQRAHFDATGTDFTPAQAIKAKDLAAASKQAEVAAESAKDKLIQTLTAEVDKLKANAERKEAVKPEVQKAKESAQKIADELFKEQNAKPAESPGKSTTLKQIGSVIKQGRAAVKSAAEAARARLNAKLGRTNLPSPQDFADYVIIGVDALADGAEKIGEFTKRMTDALGESVLPHIQEIYDEAKKQIAGLKPEQTPKERRESLIENAKDAEDPSPKTINRYATELARAFIQEGDVLKFNPKGETVVDLNKLTARVGDALKEAFPEQFENSTARDIHDAISGRGIHTSQSAEPVEVLLGHAKEQLRLVEQIESINRNEPNPPTGLVRRAPAEETRQLQKQRNEAKKEAAKKFGPLPVDRAKQLQSALGAIKTRLNNAIEDAKMEILTGRETVKTRGTPPSDAEVVALKKTLADLKEQKAKIFGEKKLTDEQRLKIATDAAQRSLDEVERKVREKDLSEKAKPNPVTSPELEAIRARRDAQKEALQELRDLDPQYATDKKLSDEQRALQSYKRRATEDIADLKERQAKGDFSDSEKPAGVKLDAEAEALKSEREKQDASYQAAKQRSILAQHVPKTPWTPEQVRAIWDFAQANYLDKGIGDFNDLVHGVATDLGMDVKDVREALAQSRATKRATDEMYAKQSAQRKVSESAKQWVRDQNTPGWLRFTRSVPRVFFINKIFGHGTVGMITHAGLNIFHPQAWKTYFPAFIKQYGLVFKPAYHERMMQDLIRDPNYTLARRAGLQNDPFKYSDDYQSAAMKTFMGKLGGLVGNRGFDALKLFRQSRFNQVWNDLPASLKTPDMAKILADSINHATGVVKMPFREWTGWTFFAPKLEASRWAWMLQDPAKAGKIFSQWGKSTPEERAFAMSELKQKASIAGTYLGLLAVNQGILSAMNSDQKVNFTDPTKSDFLSFKVAGHNVGAVGPMLGLVRLFANLAHQAIGHRTNYEQRDSRGQEMMKTAGQYVRGKLSPFAGQVANVATQSDYQGRPLPFSKDKVPSNLAKRGVGRYTYGEYAAKEFSPIPAEEAIKEVWSDQGIGPAQAKDYMRALMVGLAAGSTGVRVSKDYKVQPSKK